MKRKLYRWLIMAASMLLVCQQVSAQQRQITGTVKDNTGLGLPGVSYLLKGTTTGTVTDADGMFSITAASDQVLVFSFIGYEQQEIAVGEKTTFDNSLTENIKTLEQVVVI